MRCDTVRALEPKSTQVIRQHQLLCMRYLEGRVTSALDLQVLTAFEILTRYCFLASHVIRRDTHYAV